MRPRANSKFPGTSSFWCRLIVPVSRGAMQAQMVPPTEKGTLTRNTARQWTAARSPPATKPMN